MKEAAPGGAPRGRGLPRQYQRYFFSSSIAALALSAATDDFPALHATSASLTSVEALLNLAERGVWRSWLRGDGMSLLPGHSSSWSHCR